jgi:hypothetical protein
MNPQGLDKFINGAKITLNKVDEYKLRLVIGTDTTVYDYYAGVKMAPPLIFCLDYRYSAPEQLVLGNPDTILTTFP